MSDAPGRSLLSRPQILRHMDEGNIVIRPFDQMSLNTASYDVRLGPWFYREHRSPGSSRSFNPFDKEQVQQYWGKPLYAMSAAEWGVDSRPLSGITKDDRLIIVDPGETILAHTVEFVGGRGCVTTEMRARSSMGRIGITVCKCAGWGDVGYVNRWTMEVTNVLRERAIPLPVGMRIAQIAFYEVDSLDTSYAAESGKYQATDDMDELVASWTPSMMLPRLYDDRDLGHFVSFIPEDLKPSA